MQRTKISARLISLVLTLAILLSAFSVFAFAEESTDDGVSASELSVAYNRTFSEGWDYTNGIVDALAKGNTAGLAYEYRNSAYNYYLKLVKQNTTPSYLYIDTDGKLADEGRTYVEFDITSGAGASLGQAVRVSISGDIKTLVEFRDDGMYVIGQNVGTSVYDLKWESLKFEFNFDYVSQETLDTAYMVRAYHNGSLISEQVWEYGKYGSGIDQIRFAFGDVRPESVGSWYGLDNIKAYSGVDNFTVLASDNYGLAVNAELAKDYVLAGSVADPDGYLRGTPDVERLDGIGTAVVHYNRTYDEGWTLSNGGSITDGGNNVDIRSEKDFEGNYNYFFRFRALGTKNGFLQVPVVEYPSDEALYFEFDIKAGVNANLGGIIQARSTTDKSVYAAGITNGQLTLFDTPVGYIGSSWLHVIMVFSNVVNDDGKYTATVYYGNNGVMTQEYDIGVINELRFGAAGGGGEDKYGDWFGLDNVQIYSGTKQFVTLPADDYGTGVDATLAKDFVIEDAQLPETPLDPDGGSDTGSSGGEFTENVDPERFLKGSPVIDRVDLDPLNPDNIWVRYNRHYGEGWDFAVGGGSSGSAIMKLEAEQKIDLSYNYYQYYEQSTTANAYWTLSPGTGNPGTTKDKMYMEFDIRAVEGCNIGGAIQMRTASDGSNPYIISFVDGYLCTNVSGSQKKLGRVTEDEWVHVIFEFDYGYSTNNPDAPSGQYKVRVWVGDQTYFECFRTAGGTFGVSQFRIGFEGSGASNHGQFWHMDNLQLYGGDNFLTIPSDYYGTAVDATAEKDFPIQTTAVSLDDMVNESLFMKIGSEYGLVNYERTPNLTDEETGQAYGCPTLIDDVLWIPLDTVLNFLSYPIYIHEDGVSFDISTGSSITYITLGRNTAVVAGEKVDLVAAPAMVTDKLGYQFLAVTIDDIAILFPEFRIYRDDMNMITFSTYEQLTSGAISQSIRIEMMKIFLFEYLTPDEFYERTEEYTDGFDHPYLITNQKRFDELSAVWYAGRAALDTDPSNDVEYDETLYKYVNRVVSSGLSSYNKYSGAAQSMALFDGGMYEGLNPACYIYDNEANSIGLLHSYKSTAGYDPIGGRLYPPYDALEPLAYAYQITKDIRFAQMAYDYAVLLCDWDHWGPGHFLNAADTAASVAVCYDWCYDAWVELGYDVGRVADGIFYHGALQGYLVSIGQPDPHGRAGGNGSNYTTMVNNWNAVCTAGVAAAALAVMNYTGYSTETKLAQSKAIDRAKVYGGEGVRMACTTVLSLNYKTLINKGLDIYAPDGSYEESVSYWAYGANNLFRYCQLLESSLGDDLGLMDTWGIDRTAYSIMHMVSSDFRVFAYNDGSVGGACNSGQFNYIAQSVGDDFLRLVRQMHINDGGFSISMTDSIFYKPVEVTDDLDMPLEYHHIGIHGYTVRSSWERGAIFAGLLGGDNDDGHGHIDAGQWIYYAQGIPFIEDIGPDGYNTYNYFSNNHMYKTTVEGHNCILASSDQVNLPAGQLRNSVSPIIETGANEHGAYTIVNTLPAYGNTVFLSCERGLLFTNDRKTVIIQDEIIPKGTQTAWWIAHYSTEQISNVEIANNGRTVYMTSKKSSLTGKPVVLRMNMVSPTPGIKFEKSTSYDYLLDATMRPGDSEAMGKQPEGDRSNWLKLLVKFENLMSIDFSVALEVIDPADPILTGYKFTVMDEWEPYADTRVKNDSVVEDEVVEVVTQRGTAKPSDVLGFATRLDALVEAGTHFEQISDFYAAITQMTYTIDKLGRDYFETSSMFADSIASYDTYYLLYSTYYNDVKTTTDSIFAISDLLIASKQKAAASE